jgi:hypothetical protein
MVSRLGALLSLLALAIQLAIPLAQFWHVAVDHLPKTTLSEQDRSDQSTALHRQSALYQSGAYHDALYCPVCQAFVSMQPAADIPAQVAMDIERSIGPPLQIDVIVYQTFLHTSASRAPPVFS